VNLRFGRKKKVLGQTSYPKIIGRKFFSKLQTRDLSDTILTKNPVFDGAKMSKKPV
jgi:hypothetical protein